MKEGFEESLKERESAYLAKIKELTANNDQGTCSVLNAHGS